ncbi:MAG: hypothetical protein Q9201_004997 [Fulgogasparrea decipioides]
MSTPATVGARYLAAMMNGDESTIKPPKTQKQLDAEAADIVIIRKLMAVDFNEEEYYRRFGSPKVKTKERKSIANISTKPRGTPQITQSDRVTRYRGTKRPFIGERVEGTPITKSPRRRGAKPREKRSASPSPEPHDKSSESPESSPTFRPQHNYLKLPTPPHTPKSSDGVSDDHNGSDGDGDCTMSVCDSVDDYDDSEIPTIWNRRFDWNQRPGTGPGIIEERDPDPFYEVRRINCRFKITGTRWTEYHRGKSTLICGPNTKPWERRKMAGTRAVGARLQLRGD